MPKSVFQVLSKVHRGWLREQILSKRLTVIVNTIKLPFMLALMNCQCHRGRLQTNLTEAQLFSFCERWHWRAPTCCFSGITLFPVGQSGVWTIYFFMSFLYAAKQGLYPSDYRWMTNKMHHSIYHPNPGTCWQSGLHSVTSAVNCFHLIFTRIYCCWSAIFFQKVRLQSAYTFINICCSTGVKYEARLFLSHGKSFYECSTDSAF